MEFEIFGKVTRQPNQREKQTKRISNQRYTIRLTRLCVYLAGIINVLLFIEFVLCHSEDRGQPPFFLKEDRDGESVYINNPEFPHRLFPKSIGRIVDPIRIPVEQNEETFRIFILGGSVAQGVPNPSFGFGRILEAMLRERYPQDRLEIINVSVPDGNSHLVLSIAEECVSIQPDLLILYMGNNEVTGPLNTDSLSERLFRRVDDPHLQKIHSNYRSNLRLIFDACYQSQTPLIVCTICVNLRDCPPFVSLHDSHIAASRLAEWETLYQRGIEAEKKSNDHDAMETYRQVMEIDPHYAELSYRIARLFFKQGDRERAESYFIQARDEDALRLRADSKINQIIREETGLWKGKGIELVDLNQYLTETNGIPGNDLFYDHIHFNFEGNYQIGHTLFERIEKILQMRHPDGEEGHLAIPSVERCKERLAYTIWDRYTSLDNAKKYLAKAPFTNQAGHAARMKQIETRLAALKKLMSLQLIHQCVAQYDSAIEMNPNDWRLYQNYGQLLMAAKRQNEAVKQYQKVVEKIPHHPEAHFDLGVAYLESGQYDEAIHCFENAIGLRPDYVNAFFNIAYTLDRQDKTNQAIAQYEKTLELDPQYADAHYQLGTIYRRREAWELAENHFREVIQIQPEATDAYISIGILYAKRNLFSTALEWFERALKMNPGDKNILRYIQAAQRQMEKQNPN